MTDQHNATFWTNERVEELKTRFHNQESFSEIARGIGHRSRNAVIGKAHRLGLHRDGAKLVPPPRPPRHRIVQRYDGRRHFEEEPMPEQTPPSCFANPKPFIELSRNDCRWPGPGAAGPDLLCCAAPQLKGYSYCAMHCRLAFVAPGARPKAPRS
jgi:GcrA cell cycle regulator